MKFFDAFAGIGGFHLGIKNAINNAFCVGYSEIDKYAISVYEKHFKGVKNYGDITKINAKELPDFDCLVGGFPCQAFSIAGKRRGFDDTRGTLFFELARILKAKQPRLFVFENVKGLLSHDSGRTFKTIITTLNELGYDLQWQVLNSKNFGVPQNRERVFIVGHLRGTTRPQVFPIKTNNKAPAQLSEQYTNTITARYKEGQATGSYVVEGKQQTQKAMLKQIVGGSQGMRVYDVSGVSTTLASQAGGLGAKTGLYAIPVLTPNRLNKRQNGRRFKNNEEPSFTITSQDRHGIYDGFLIRRLTPLECERLQAFPDNWTKYDKDNKAISDNQRYKMLGNAVTTSVVKVIFRMIKKDLKI